MKVLLTRTDRLGDLVLSLPAVDQLAAARPDWEIHLMVAPAAVPLVEHHPRLARVWTWDDGMGVAAQRVLRDELRAEGIAAAVMLQYRRELALLLREAGIGRRHGPWSKTSSWLLLNRGRWQARSRRTAHEADLGAELVAALAGPDAGPLLLPRLYPDPQALDRGLAFRRERAAGAEIVAFVHPGSGGSALDWAPAGFAALASVLADRPRWQVFITGAGADAAAIGAMDGLLDPRVEVVLDAWDLRGLLGVLAAGDVFVGPSTGPLHMAAALDLATIGLYPPVRAMAPDRWGPRGLWAEALVPAVACPARRTCRGVGCTHWNCMDGLDPGVVAETIVALASRRSTAKVADREETQA